MGWRDMRRAWVWSGVLAVLLGVSAYGAMRWGYERSPSARTLQRPPGSYSSVGSVTFMVRPREDGAGVRAIRIIDEIPLEERDVPVLATVSMRGGSWGIWTGWRVRSEMWMDFGGDPDMIRERQAEIRRAVCEAYAEYNPWTNRARLAALREADVVEERVQPFGLALDLCTIGLQVATVLQVVRWCRLWPRVHRARRLAEYRGECPRCGYDASGLAVCPECGGAMRPWRGEA
jgi:hypothetical protein